MESILPFHDLVQIASRISELTQPTAHSRPTLLWRLPAKRTGIDLTYEIDPNDPNCYLYTAGFECGGVATGDVYVTNYDAIRQLYINDGTGRFHERGHRFGLDIADASLSATFCDWPTAGSAWPRLRLILIWMEQTHEESGVLRSSHDGSWLLKHRPSFSRPYGT